MVHVTNDKGVSKLFNSDGSTEIEDLYKFHMDNSQAFYLKLRPFVREFLREVKQLFEINMYTFGSRRYAIAVSKILDPEQQFFNPANILCRDDFGQNKVDQKSLSKIFPTDFSMALIVDDRMDVWGTSKNLINIVPYHFFADTLVNMLPRDMKQHQRTDKGKERKTKKEEQQVLSKKKEERREEERGLQETEGLEGSEEMIDVVNITTDELVKGTINQHDHPLENARKRRRIEKEEKVYRSENGREEDVLLKYDPKVLHDSCLNTILGVLKQVHSTFYEQRDKLIGEGIQGYYDVRFCLNKVRKQILSGVHILFSAIFPIGTTPHLTTLWILAETFGATCHVSWCNSVTHVVASKVGTKKVREAYEKGNVHVVHVNWILNSLRCYSRLDESEYILPKEKKIKEDTGKSGGLSHRQHQLMDLLFHSHVMGMEAITSNAFIPTGIQQKQPREKITEEEREALRNSLKLPPLRQSSKADDSSSDELSDSDSDLDSDFDLPPDPNTLSENDMDVLEEIESDLFWE
eukprot:CAMPEP_0174269792 /NCGR_PEP_ID=MMETSP0439-20130205/42291_1 /TAXON_ID=0 /ORGANISM="Stereomyxa ramosa, Strain Chinc5" /LENGTH=520 /DNA_ID=CAMNT_0015358743 /DNA_START=216 /DNA_END=1778 /DNA_ORIENTATION=+